MTTDTGRLSVPTRRLVPLLIALSVLLAIGVGGVAAIDADDAESGEDAEAIENTSSESVSEVTEDVTVEIVGEEEDVSDDLDGAFDLEIEQPEIDEEFEFPTIEVGF